MADTRYPYTYASDLLRVNPQISRSEASQIRRLMAEALGMDDNNLARKLADYWIEHENEITEVRTAEFLEKLNRM